MVNLWRCLCVCAVCVSGNVDVEQTTNSTRSALVGSWCTKMNEVLAAPVTAWLDSKRTPRKRKLKKNNEITNVKKVLRK